jgi:hypothetical protein
MSNIDKLRGKACRKVMQSAARNDVWNMKRFAQINRYLAELPKGEK